MEATYLFERREKPILVSGPFVSWRPLSRRKVPTLSAQALQEQFILRQIENKVDLHDIAKN